MMADGSIMVNDVREETGIGDGIKLEGGKEEIKEIKN